MEKFINRLKRINWKPKIKRICIALIISGFAILIIPFILHYSFTKTYSEKIYNNIEDIPQKKVAIVFGAGLAGKGLPGDILKDRIEASAELYKAGKVEKIIMSGDNRFVDYDEPSAMIDYAIQLGIPEENLEPDYAGRRTYDTCTRAKLIFGVDEAVLVTQRFHMTRAMYICNSKGIDSVGMIADKHHYEGENFNKIRDIYSFSLALWDVNIGNPGVVMGEQINIY